MRREALKAALAVGLSLAAFSARAKKKSKKSASPSTGDVDNRALGTWKSDKDKTLQLWRIKPDADPAERERAEALFGRLTLRYTPNFVYANFDGQTTKQRYRVVAADERSMVVEYQEDSHPVLEQLFFEDDYLYKVAGHNIEFFKRFKV